MQTLTKLIPSQKVNEKGISMYFHLPFCHRRCSYCDFEIITTKSDKMINVYLENIIKEVLFYKKYIYPKSIKSIYFGGGTPSFISVDILSSFLNEIENILEYDKNIEITIELNPQDCSLDMFEMLKKYVNRVSIGCQSFSDKVLNKLGRIHDKNMNITAINNAKLFFQNISADIIVGFQNKNELIYDLQTIQSYKLSHISLYSLILEQGSRLFQIDTELKNQDNLYILARDYLVNNGYSQYEISNFCIDKEYSKHNLRYWDMSYYIGVGAGSSGFFPAMIEDKEILIRHNNYSFFKYLSNIKNHNKYFEYEIIDNKTFFMDYILCAIRTIFGISKAVLNEVDYKYLLIFEKFNKENNLFIEYNECYILKNEYFLIQDTVILKIYDLL